MIHKVIYLKDVFHWGLGIPKIILPSQIPSCLSNSLKSHQFPFQILLSHIELIKINFSIHCACLDRLFLPHIFLEIYKILRWLFHYSNKEVFMWISLLLCLSGVLGETWHQVRIAYRIHETDQVLLHVVNALLLCIPSLKIDCIVHHIYWVTNLTKIVNKHFKKSFQFMVWHLVYICSIILDS